jgi:hypothetical protein
MVDLVLSGCHFDGGCGFLFENVTGQNPENDVDYDSINNAIEDADRKYGYWYATYCVI